MVGGMDDRIWITRRLKSIDQEQLTGDSLAMRNSNPSSTPGRLESLRLVNDPRILPPLSRMAVREPAVVAQLHPFRSCI